MDKFFEANVVFSLFAKNYMELKMGLPIRPSEMGVLNILTQTPGPHTSVLLSQLLSVSKPMITAHLTSLVEKGYITKEQSAEDKRAFYVLPTEKALNLVASVKKKTDSQLSRLMETMGAEEFETFVALARKANQVLAESGGEER